MKKGILTVISGFSGAGKGTIMKELLSKYSYFLSISATTRSPREGEIDGVHYYFQSKESFEKMIQNNELVEWAEYVGNYYGTPKKALQEQLDEGKDVILEIEMQGGMSVKEQFPDALLIFIVPPTADELRSRLVGRGTESKEQITNRLAHANEEAAFMKAYDYIVINDNLEDAVEQIHSIIQNQHCIVNNRKDFIEAMEMDLKQFLKGE